MMGIIKKIRNRIIVFGNNLRNRKYVKKHDINDFPIKEIEIETLNRCNGKCAFCPVNVNEPQRDYAKMSDQTFEKIISELAELEYSETLSLFSNNEPFLDERIIDFYKLARKSIPKARLSIFTNGSLLSVSKLEELIDYVDYMVIDNYNDSLEVNSNLKEVYDYIQIHEELKEKVHFVVRRQNQIRFSRGGQAPNKKNVEGIKELCLLPYRQMVIRPTGEVSLCCNDALGKYTLGNVQEDKIIDIWKSEKFNEIRKEMYCNGRKNLQLCKNCDTVTRV